MTKRAVAAAENCNNAFANFLSLLRFYVNNCRFNTHVALCRTAPMPTKSSKPALELIEPIVKE
jgi:hypothetical protein